ncbi:hypothetical protein JWH11_02535, partial [Xanthomonas melonis]|nr:hypothetical protein [Xanthomonas melonis]MCD0265332.1 hypothetical protein [Xanthomonas melonis]
MMWFSAFSTTSEGQPCSCSNVEAVRRRSWMVKAGVSADVKLTHCGEVKVTHLGHDGGLLKAADVDSGASS